MKQICVDKNELLKIIRQNRNEHRSIFLEAQKKFRVVAIAALDRSLKLARKGRPFELRQLGVLAAPEDHTSEYDRAIAMLEMSVDTNIVISDQEFAHFVQDIWRWSQEWAASNLRYVGNTSKSFSKLSVLAKGHTD